MRGLSVIIPSRNADNLEACVRAIRKSGEACQIIVVSDFDLSEEHDAWNRTVAVEEIGKLGWISGNPRPFVFSKNVNTGIGKAGDDSVVVLNDDALLQTPGGFSLLQQAAEEHPFGIIAATTNVTGNENQRPKGIGLREEKGTIPFICVYVPRRTIDTVGLMDERFGGTTADGRRIYGFCDNDYCRRVKNAGLKLALHDGCYVDHSSLQSSFRGDPHAAGDISAAKEIYLEKWGSLD